MSLRKKIIIATAALALLGGLSACSSERDSSSPGAASGGPDGGKDALIGIAMPTKSLERWNNDGAHLEKKLKDMGYKTSLQYADNKVEQQISQVDNMINQGAKVLVIASIDGSSLNPTLEKAASQGVKVFAYDRLLTGGKNVDYYATFDNEKIGQMIGAYLVDKKNLDSLEGSLNIEPFAGDPGDNNVSFFFRGFYSKVEPYIKSGKLVTPSGKMPTSADGWKSIAITNWDPAKAQSEMDTRLNSFYTGGKKVDVVYGMNDSLSLGIEQALESAGYEVGQDWPMVLGMDADEANSKNIVEGKQTMTVWKDTRKLGDQVATMVDQIMKGEKVEVNNTSDYNNGVKNVPSFLLTPEVIDKGNIKKLVDSGFYSAEQLGL